jgi:hypothetical protein
MPRLVFHVERRTLPPVPVDGEIHVWLYGSSPPAAHVGVVGSQAFDAASRLWVQPSRAAMDFLSIAMAVTAADTFVLRDAAFNRWNREFEIVLPLAEPVRWQSVQQELEAALLFLSGDTWHFRFERDGVWPPPMEAIRRRVDVLDLSKVDCVALFSGGLDSAIGVKDLIALGNRPLLVSHASRGDADHQNRVATLLPPYFQRMSVNTYPTLKNVDDDNMRTRSFQFLALAALACQTLTSFRGLTAAKLYICENGLIALNPPLTPRRIGSLSTRTAHPHFLSSIQKIWTTVGIPASIENPYAFETKGEMVHARSDDEGFPHFVAETVSCGKWKRRNQQCGRCVPCLIRRSSLHAAGVADETSYEFDNLLEVMADTNGRDDLIAVQSAISRLRNQPMGRWVLQAGPLPWEAELREKYFAVARRGMNELEGYLRSVGFDLD